MCKRLCFVSSEIYPGTKGGIGRLICANSHQLHKSGLKLTFLLAVDGVTANIFKKYAKENFPGSEVYSVDELLNDLTPDENIPLWAFHFSNYYLSYRIALALYRLCSKIPFDGIEFTDYAGLGYVTIKWRRLWGDVFSNTTIWIRFHGTEELCRRADDDVIFDKENIQKFEMERYCLKYADGWISPSKDIIELYQSYYGFSNSHIMSVPLFERIGQGKQHSRVFNPPYRILFFGKLQRLKGIDTFVKAAVQLLESSQLPLEFEIIGHDVPTSWSNSYQKELELLIPDNLRDKFHIHGGMEIDRLENLVLTCTLAVIPSRIETFCLAAHELNWIGIPLVLNKIPAFSSFFTDGESCRYFDGTALDLARILLSLLQEPDPFKEWTWNATEIISRQDIIKDYDNVFHLFKPPEFIEYDGSESSDLVSIVIPYYNMQNYIDDTLSSIMGSTYRNLEIIVVDDGSTLKEAQDKFELLQREYSQDIRFRFFRKKNGGLGSTRNYGIRLAKGKYILPLDSDDVIHPLYIERGIQALNRQTELQAVSCYVNFFRDGQPPEQAVDYVIPYDLHPVLITLEDRVGVACSLFRREVFIQFQYDEDLVSYEDWELWWKLAEHNYKVETMPKILYRYRSRQESMYNATATSRHVYLLKKIAESHKNLLQRYGNQIYQALVKTNHELQRQNPPTQHFKLEERLLLRIADFLLHNNLYNKLRPILKRVLEWARNKNDDQKDQSVLSFPVKDAPTEITIRATGTSNLMSQSTEVWLLDILNASTGLPLDYSILLKNNPGWQIIEPSNLSFGEKGVVAHKGATLHINCVDGIVIRILKHPWSGVVMIQTRNHKERVNLYSPNAGVYIYPATNR